MRASRRRERNRVTIVRNRTHSARASRTVAASIASMATARSIAAATSHTLLREQVKYFRRIAMPSFGSPSESCRNADFAARFAGREVLRRRSSRDARAPQALLPPRTHPSSETPEHPSLDNAPIPRKAGGRWRRSSNEGVVKAATCRAWRRSARGCRRQCSRGDRA